MRMMSIWFLDGFAFSQDENGALRQSEIVKFVDTTKKKPKGN